MPSNYRSRSVPHQSSHPTINYHQPQYNYYGPVINYQTTVNVHIHKKNKTVNNYGGGGNSSGLGGFFGEIVAGMLLL